MHTGHRQLMVTPAISERQWGPQGFVLQADATAEEKYTKLLWRLQSAIFTLNIPLQKQSMLGRLWDAVFNPEGVRAMEEQRAAAVRDLAQTQRLLGTMQAAGELKFLDEKEHRLVKLVVDDVHGLAASSQELKDMNWPRQRSLPRLVEKPAMSHVFKELEAGSGQYVREGEPTAAFVDKGNALIAHDESADTYRAVLELAKSKGWMTIELAGKLEDVAQGWIEAQLQGIEVTNFAPNEQDVAALRARRAELAAEKATELEEPALKVAAAEVVMVKGARVVTAGRHLGSVIEIAGEHVIQRTGMGQVAHEWKAGRMPKAGDMLDIEYQRGQAVLHKPRVQSRGERE